MHQLFQWQAFTPAFRLQLWLIQKLADIAQAQIRQGVDLLGQLQNIRQPILIDNTNLAHTNTFRSRRQPQILYRQASAEQIHFNNRVTAQYVSTTPAAIAGNT